MTRSLPLAACLSVIGAIGLSACNQTSASAPAPVAAAAAPGVTPSSFSLPSGSGCAGEIARFRAVVDNDLATGHTTATVHARIRADLDGAASACTAGREAEAVRAVASTKSRFGYP